MYLKLKLWALAFCVVVAAVGHARFSGYAAGYDVAQDDCYGMDCEQYTLIIGQAAKEQRTSKVKPDAKALDKLMGSL